MYQQISLDNARENVVFFLWSFIFLLID